MKTFRQVSVKSKLSSKNPENNKEIEKLILFNRFSLILKEVSNLILFPRLPLIFRTVIDDLINSKNVMSKIY